MHLNVVCQIKDDDSLFLYLVYLYFIFFFVLLFSFCATIECCSNNNPSCAREIWEHYKCIDVYFSLIDICHLHDSLLLFCNVHFARRIWIIFFSTLFLFLYSLYIFILFIQYFIYLYIYMKRKPHIYFF